MGPEMTRMDSGMGNFLTDAGGKYLDNPEANEDPEKPDVLFLDYLRNKYR